MTQTTAPRRAPGIGARHPHAPAPAAPARPGEVRGARPFAPLALALAALLALGGCAGLARSGYERPALAVPSRWSGANACTAAGCGRDPAGQGGAAPTATTAATAPPTATIPGLAPDDSGNARLARASEVPALALDGWWRDLGDPALDGLIDRLLVRNNDLAAATQRVRQARLSAGLQADALVPAASASLSGTRGRSLSGQGRTRSNAASASLAWEADLWGRLAASRDAADWEARATDADRAATALSLVGTAASLWLDLGYVNERIALGEANIANARRVLELVQLQYRAGSVSSLEVDEARQTLAALEAAQTSWLLERDQDRHAFSILLDLAPGADANPWAAEPRRLPEAALPAIPAGLPAELLARRPDLAAAEARLRSTLASADATRLGYYPRFSLTGTLGGSSAALADVLANPVATLGAGLTLPFLQQTERQLAVASGRAAYAEAVASFRQSFLSALADVEDALSARAQYEARARPLEESLAAARRAEAAYELRYRAGSVALRTWLDAQRTRRDAEAALAANRLDRLLNRIALHQALGGRAGG
ncbi:efflux transporter outer membrane subunit [Derxia gummosa]|uniref:Efflux transporter outer membrane subunit n=1 Tax=Derxia gummosa DSM 723 TaxID=1121388 RepID=A0A8B6XC68_9BURK|nr:TolC family protein [Derxia gummosa]